jgi:LysR family transcriptional regulator for metE and metH
MNMPHGLEGRDLLDVEVRHLRLLVAIVEEGSVTKAGARLHLTQSALSHQLSDLEDRLGTQLFSRTRAGLVLTSAGHRLLDVAHDVLTRLHTARREFAATANDAAGVLRITTECLTCYHWLPRVMKWLNAKYPGVQMEVDAAASTRPVEAVLEGKVDLALAYSPAPRAVVRKPLFDDEWVAVMAPSHPLAKRSFLHAVDFKDETAILYSSNRKSMLIFQKYFVTGSIEPKNILAVQLTEAMIELAKANLGIAILTRWSVEPEVRAGRVVARSLGREGLHREWSAIYRKQRNPPRYLTDLVELLQTTFPRGPALAVSAGA